MKEEWRLIERPGLVVVKLIVVDGNIIVDYVVPEYRKRLLEYLEHGIAFPESFSCAKFNAEPGSAKLVGNLCGLYEHLFGLGAVRTE